MIRNKIIYILIVVFLSTIFLNNNVSANMKYGEIYSHIVIDAKTGEILLSENAKEEVSPASITKIMTAYLVLEEVKKGNLKWDTKIKITSDYVHWMGLYGGSRVGLQKNKTYTVKELFDGLLIKSGNDTAIALAEHISGTEEEFVKRMNITAKELKMENTYFVTSNGLPIDNIAPKYRPNAKMNENIMSAYDTAILSRQLITKYPEVLETTNKTSIKIKNNIYTTTNGLLRDNQFKGLDGLKTGFTYKAGYTITATAERDGVRLIVVTMGRENAQKRNKDTVFLLKEGFEKVKKVEEHSKLMAFVSIGTMSVIADINNQINKIPIVDNSTEEQVISDTQTSPSIKNEF